MVVLFSLVSKMLFQAAKLHHFFHSKNNSFVYLRFFAKMLVYSDERKSRGGTI